MKEIKRKLEKKSLFVKSEYWFFQIGNYIKSLNSFLIIIFISCIGLAVLFEAGGNYINEHIRAPLSYLAYSYISAYIFYLLVVFAPLHKKKKTLNLYIHNRTAFIVQITWRIYWSLLTKSGESEETINKHRYEVPRDKELETLLTNAKCFNNLVYADLNFNKNNFFDYDDLLDEVCRVIIIYMNDLFKFQDLLYEVYFEKLLDLEQTLLIHNFKIGGQRIKSSDVHSLSLRLSGFLEKTKALKESASEISSSTFKRNRYVAKIRALRIKHNNKIVRP